VGRGIAHLLGQRRELAAPVRIDRKPVIGPQGVAQDDDDLVRHIEAGVLVDLGVLAGDAVADEHQWPANVARAGNALRFEVDARLQFDFLPVGTS
jgi:hypothetical protein